MKPYRNRFTAKECERCKRLDEIIKIKWKITSHIEMDEFSSELSWCVFFRSFIFIILWNWLSFFHTHHTNTRGKKTFAFSTQKKEPRFSSEAFVIGLMVENKTKSDDDIVMLVAVSLTMRVYQNKEKLKSLSLPVRKQPPPATIYYHQYWPSSALTPAHFKATSFFTFLAVFLVRHRFFSFISIRSISAYKFLNPQRIEAIFDYSLWWWLVAVVNCSSNLFFFARFFFQTFFIHYIFTNLYAMYGWLHRSHLPTKKHKYRKWH